LGSFSGTNVGSLTLTTGDPTVFNGALSSQTASYTVGGSVATTGVLAGGSFTAPVTAELGSIPNVTVNVSGTAVQNRVITSSTAALGDLLVGYTSGAQTATLTSTGDLNDNTTVAIKSGTSTGTGASAGVSVVSGSVQTFNGTNTTATVSVSGNFATSTSGTAAGTVALATTGENLPGEVDTAIAAYTANVYQTVGSSDMITGTSAGAGSSVNLMLSTGSSTDGGQRAAVDVTGFTSTNPNFILTTTGNSTGVATTAPTTAVEVGNVAVSATTLNGTYTYTGNVSGTAEYSDVPLQSQGTPGTPTWNGVSVTETVNGHTSSGTNQVFTTNFTSGQSYAGYGLTSGVPGGVIGNGQPTVATLLSGSAPAGGANVSMSFSAIGTLHPGSQFQSSDVLTLTGIPATSGTNSGGASYTGTYVIQMSFSLNSNVLGGVSSYFIGWWDPAANNGNGAWVNAIAGNTNVGQNGGSFYTDSFGNPAPGPQDGQYSNLAFNSSISTENALGDYGSYESGGFYYAWAVVNYDATFVVTPEPETWGMIVGGFAMLIGIQRFRRKNKSD